MAPCGVQAMQRLVKALQRALAREAVLPSVGSAVGAAAIGSLARLALACGDVAAVAPRQGLQSGCFIAPVGSPFRLM